VNLLEYLVDVGRVGFLTLALSLLLVTVCGGRGLLGSLAGLSSGGFLVDRACQYKHIRYVRARYSNSLAALPPVEAGALPPVDAGALDAGLGGMVGWESVVG